MAARAESQPRLAISEVLDRALQRPQDLAETLPDIGAAGINPLHMADDITVLQVVWAPGMHFRPDSHEMWACIGIFGGQEDNTFFRRRESDLVDATASDRSTTASSQSQMPSR
jgi:predicted metal-dependent enzyme (double-stranded beta helix superfamily)